MPVTSVREPRSKRTPSKAAASRVAGFIDTETVKKQYKALEDAVWEVSKTRIKLKVLDSIGNSSKFDKALQEFERMPRADKPTLDDFELLQSEARKVVQNENGVTKVNLGVYENTLEASDFRAAFDRLKKLVPETH